MLEEQRWMSLRIDLFCVNSISLVIKYKTLHQRLYSWDQVVSAFRRKIVRNLFSIKVKRRIAYKLLFTRTAMTINRIYRRWYRKIKLNLVSSDENNRKSMKMMHKLNGKRIIKVVNCFHLNSFCHRGVRSWLTFIQWVIIALNLPQLFSNTLRLSHFIRVHSKDD